MNQHKLTPREQLIAVRELLSDPGKWTEGSFARDVDGRDLDDPFSKQATCWCVQGALCKVSGFDVLDVDDCDAYRALMRVSAGFGGPYDGPINVNDEQGYEAVMGMLTEAIRYLDAEVE